MALSSEWAPQATAPGVCPASAACSSGDQAAPSTPPKGDPRTRRRVGARDIPIPEPQQASHACVTAGSRAQPLLWVGLGPWSPLPTRAPDQLSRAWSRGRVCASARLQAGAAGLRRPGRGLTKLCEHNPAGCHSWGDAKLRCRHTLPATRVCRGHPADCTGDGFRWALFNPTPQPCVPDRSLLRTARPAACWVPLAGRTCLSPGTCAPHPTPDPTHSPCLHPVSRHLTALLPFPDPPGPRLGDKPQTLACGTRALPEQLAQQSSGRGGWDGPPQNSHADWAADLAQGTGLKTAGGRRPYTLGWDQLFQLSTFKCQDCTKQTNSRKMHVSEQHRRHQPPAGTAGAEAAAAATRGPAHSSGVARHSGCPALAQEGCHLCSSVRVRGTPGLRHICPPVPACPARLLRAC